MNFGLVYLIMISYYTLIETFHLTMSLLHTELDIDFKLLLLLLTRLGEDP